ncbi:MAG: periplasmic heavy metal sensor [Xanthobacteraceae bacterium]
MNRILSMCVLLLIAPSAFAQRQPYAGLEQRTVKALSAEQIADLREGRGMGLALAAELNGYPGPVHVLEHADALNLSAEQRERTRALFAAMRAETVPLGEQLIAQEATLDRAFADRTVTPQTLAHTTAAIGATQAALRAAHLRYHLAQVEVLSPEQISRYNELRGYAGNAQNLQNGHRPGGHHAK